MKAPRVLLLRLPPAGTSLVLRGFGPIVCGAVPFPDAPLYPSALRGKP